MITGSPPKTHSLRHELEEVEKHVCPNLSSSRNAFQAVVEILARRKVASRVRPWGAAVFDIPT